MQVACESCDAQGRAVKPAWLYTAVGWKGAQVLNKLQVAFIRCRFESAVGFSTGIHSMFGEK